MKSRYSKTQRVFAVIGIVLLVGLYVTALICSFFSKKELARQLLTAALFCTVIIPIIIWFFQFFIGRNKKPENTEKDEE